MVIRGAASGEGFDFVRCRVCGDHRRVISARHLSKHEIDRETYMAEYRLSPDQLIAKDFRLIQSSRRDYHPYGKSDWVSAIKAIYKKTGNVFAGYLQKKYPHVYFQGVWIYGDWDKALRAAGFDPKSMRQRRSWTGDKVIEGINRLRSRRLPLYAKYVMKSHQRPFLGSNTAIWNVEQGATCRWCTEDSDSEKNPTGYSKSAPRHKGEPLGKGNL